MKHISKLSEWPFRISVCGHFSAIAIPYRYGSAVSLGNTYIHLHAVSRLAGTNCTNRLQSKQQSFILNALFCKTIKSQQLAYHLDFQFISTFRCITRVTGLSVKLTLNLTVAVYSPHDITIYNKTQLNN